MAPAPQPPAARRLPFPPAPFAKLCHTCGRVWQTSAKQTGFRQLRLFLKLAGGRWLVSDQTDDDATDWRVRECTLADLRWRVLDIATVTEGRWEPVPDLSRVDEVGCTDLLPGGRTPASSRLDWLEVYGRPVPR